MLSTIRLFGLLCVGLALSACVLKNPAADSELSNGNWTAYGGDVQVRQFSPLTQITIENVSELEQAWIYNSAPGYELPPTSELQVNPLVINGVVYGISPEYVVFALNGENGKSLWRFDPAEHIAEVVKQGKEAKFGLRLSHKRGFAYWQHGQQQRLFFSAAHLLMAIDARTGELVSTFGKSGVVDLREGLGRPIENLGVAGNTPGVVFENLLIMGTRVGEHKAAAPGHIRAYDVNTGDIVWTFRTIPQPGEKGSETWPQDAWKEFGGANAWAGLSVDEKRALVFAPTGAPSEDFVGTGRHGSNLFGNSLLALNARTGELVWHYQLVHHDLWDRDLNSAPTLVTIERDGEAIDAVAQTTKQGFVFVFNRETGESLFPIKEVPVPASSVPGEKSWPTQPRPLAPPPFVREHFNEEDLANLNPLSHAVLLKQFRELLPPGYFAPLGPDARILLPGYDGGATWGGAAYSRDTGLLVVNSQDRPAIAQVGPMPGGNHPGNQMYQYVCAQCHLPDRQGVENAIPALHGLAERYTSEALKNVIVEGRGRMAPMPIPEPMLSSLVNFLLLEEVEQVDAGQGEQPYVFTGYRYFTDPDGYPAIKPPWGTLNAIDLNEGKIAWQVVLGEHKALREQGFPPTGTLNYGGPVVTASGLVFIAATMDSKLRAFELTTGKELWQADLPAPAFSTPAIYKASGKQYVVVACGGGKLGTKPGDAYVAFRLPE